FFGRTQVQKSNQSGDPSPHSKVSPVSFCQNSEGVLPMRRVLCLCLFALGGVMLVSLTEAGEGRLEYPSPRRIDHVDVFHGAPVPDPYRWLEEDVRKSEEVAGWVEAQNKLTFAYLEAIPQRERIHRRLKELWNYERYSAPAKVGGRYFYSKNDGLQNQSVLYT